MQIELKKEAEKLGLHQMDYVRNYLDKLYTYLSKETKENLIR